MSASTNGIKYFFAFIGRVFFCVFFIFNGLFNATSYNAMVKSLSQISGIHGLLITLTVLQLIGGVLLIIGWYSRLAAFLLFIAVVLMTWVEFLIVPVDTATVSATFVTATHFIDNLGFAGATLYFMAFGAGAWSIDILRSRGKQLS